MTKRQSTSRRRAAQGEAGGDPGQSAERKQGQTPPARTDAEKRHLDEMLEEALEETFPASDPIAVTVRSEPPATARRDRREPSLRRPAAARKE